MDLPDNLRAWSRTGLGLIQARGADAVAFMQGQLSNDVALLAPGTPQLAGYHNPQGRVVALMWLLQRAPDDILALLPPALAVPVATRLSRFVLRSKVRVSAQSATAPEFASALDAARIGTEPLAPNDFRLANIAAGLPQVYAATSEGFVAQMLNLDAVGGISFEKGCYTGQEVIARAHYRGRVKRRMQRFLTDSPAVLAPGDTGTLPDGRAFKVVEAAQRADGRCEFLAVAPIVGTIPDDTTGGFTSRVAGTSAEADAGPDEPTASGQQPLAAQALPLPYALPVD